jgi:uncharacterized protein YggT (Ycf19 family)
MTLLDQILNLVCVLLWLNWRSHAGDPLTLATPVTLAGTLRRAENRRFKGWKFLAAVILLLLFRAIIYRQIGPGAEWTPKMNLVFVALAFRSDNLTLCLLYSALSFGRALLVLYVWLLAVALINRGRVDPGPVQKLVRQQLGPVASWPWILQLLLPFILTIAIWLGLNPLLLRLNITGHSHSFLLLLEQGALVGLGIVFALKYLFLVLLVFHLLLTYVYLGGNPIWEFISGTAGNLLAPINWVPLRLGKLDLAPILGILLAVALLHVVPEVSLRKMLDRNLTIWPQ